jgi:hypothetical protein
MSSEDRCLTAWEFFQNGGVTPAGVFLEVVDPPSRFSNTKNALVGQNRNKLALLGGPPGGIITCDLLAPHHQIVKIADDFLATSGGNVLLDITCLPKRFFFPFVRLLLRSLAVKNLIVFYTKAESYFEGPLTENPLPLSHLPLFGPEEFPEKPFDVAFVGIGTSPLGIVDMFAPTSRELVIKLLFPFPASPKGYRTSWEFIRNMQKNLPDSAKDPLRVSALDVSDVFDHIVNETGKGKKRAIFAPYGPKPMSLAMCIYASLAGSTVSYSQPTVYHPNYSTGIKFKNGVPETYAYLLRIDGKDFYSL